MNLVENNFYLVDKKGRMFEITVGEHGILARKLLALDSMTMFPDIVGVNLFVNLLRKDPDRHTHTSTIHIGPPLSTLINSILIIIKDAF